VVWWVVAFVCLGILMVAVLVKTDNLASEHKRLLGQFRTLDQENSQVQQFTFELAEEFSQFLLLQLGSVRRMSRLAEDELLIFELAIQLIPTLCKEMSSRHLALKPALQRALKLHADIELNAVEAVVSKHGRLINGWQKQNFGGYLQMCQQMYLLAKECSHKENLRPITTGAVI